MDLDCAARSTSMPVSAAKVVMISVFLIGGMLLAGVIMQPEASLLAWDVSHSDFPANSSQQDRLSFLLRYAILAPSSHNSQPWKFNVSKEGIRVYADETRWLSVADPDQREMYISIGCALENLAIAAEHFGYSSNVTYSFGRDEPVALFRMQPEALPADDLNGHLFSAITSRGTNRNPYEARRISADDLAMLHSCIYDPEVSIYLADDAATRDGFRRLAVQADEIQYRDADYKSELGHWLGQGGMGPTGLKAMASQLAVVFLDAGPDQVARDAELINSSPYIGFVATSKSENESISDFKISALRAGRALERFWLAATALGLGLQPMSQALEVQETKEAAAGLLPTNTGNMSRLQQTFRLGYAPDPGEHTPRRPLEEMMREK